MHDLSIDAPTPFHIVELIAADDGKISSVSVYPAHAEVTRSFKVGLKAGANQVKISGLPNVLNQDSLRFAWSFSLTAHTNHE
jgi:N-terminal domain of unknown function (DUF4140)